MAEFDYLQPLMDRMVGRRDDLRRSLALLEQDRIAVRDGNENVTGAFIDLTKRQLGELDDVIVKAKADYGLTATD